MPPPRPSPPRNFLTAVLYGVAMMAALSNTLALLQSLGTNQIEWSNVSLGLLGWSIVLYIHRARGWLPFHKR